MPHELYEWLRRIKDVEREHSATRLATERLVAIVQHDPTILDGDLTPRDITRAAEHLEGTYIIRLFAEFETALRIFWPTVRGTDPPGRTRDLLDGLAATRRIPHDQCMAAHAVREYRNTLVHLREVAAAPMSIAEARSHLCKFVSFLPPNW